MATFKSNTKLIQNGINTNVINANVRDTIYRVTKISLRIFQKLFGTVV